MPEAGVRLRMRVRKDEAGRRRRALRQDGYNQVVVPGISDNPSADGQPLSAPLREERY